MDLSFGQSSILISGLQGLGIEIAKNIIVGGAKFVTLHDDHEVELWDLSSGLFLSMGDERRAESSSKKQKIGLKRKSRAEACVEELRKLNSAVEISVVNELTEELLSSFQVVVFTDISLDKAKEFDEYCHRHEPPIAFIKCEVRGLFGNIFCDFGPNYTFSDVNNGKDPQELKFKTLQEALEEPGEFVFAELRKLDRLPLLHIAFQALDAFRAEKKCFPVSGAEEDARRLIDIVAAMNDGKLDVNENVLRKFAFGARAVISPMATIFGGLVGQEILKACSRKFYPIFQFFYFDHVLSGLAAERVDPDNLRPKGSRYDAQISIFGSRWQKRVVDSKVLVVGFGVVGSELLKSLAMMGVSCADTGKMFIADDDVIERSDIAGQFLFKETNISYPKVATARNALFKINPELRVRYTASVKPDSEDDTVWKDLTVVIDALDDDVNAKLYIDQKCVQFKKPIMKPFGSNVLCNFEPGTPDVDRHIASRLIPGTSRLISIGLMCLRLYRVLLKHHRYDHIVPRGYQRMADKSWTFPYEDRSNDASPEAIRLSRVGRFVVNRNALRYRPSFKEGGYIGESVEMLMKSDYVKIRNGLDLSAVLYLWKKTHYKGRIYVVDDDMMWFLKERMVELRDGSPNFVIMESLACNYSIVLAEAGAYETFADDDGVDNDEEGYYNHDDSSPSTMVSYGSTDSTDSKESV